jgi:hypothetical protein
VAAATATVAFTLSSFTGTIADDDDDSDIICTWLRRWCIALEDIWEGAKPCTPATRARRTANLYMVLSHKSRLE